MGLTDIVKDRILSGYEKGNKDFGKDFSKWMSNPATRWLTLKGVKAATKKNMTDLAIKTGMTDAVLQERLDAAYVFFDIIAESYKEGMPKSYQEGIPNSFMNKLITGRVNAEEIMEKYGFIPPRTLVISQNMTCNKSCFQCYAPAILKNEKPDDIQQEMWNRMSEILEPKYFNKVIKEFNELNGNFVTITGGEPLFYLDKKTGTRFVDPTGKRNDIIGQNPDTLFMVYTNAKGINDSIAERIAETGNVIFCPSLEGLEESTDRRRGKGTFKDVMRAMDVLNKYKIPHGASITVFGGNHKNVEEVVSDEFIDVMKEKKTKLIWYFPWFPMMAETPEDVQLFPTPEERFYTLREGIIDMRKNKSILAVDFSDGLLINDWKNSYAMNRGCIAAGNGLLHVNQDGIVDPCVFLKFSIPELNIKKKSLIEIMQHPYMVDLREHQSNSHNPLIPCFPRDHLDQMRDMKKKYNAIASSPKCRICENQVLDEKIIEYNLACKKMADKIAIEKYGFNPNPNIKT